MIEEMSLSRWLAVGSPSVVVLGVLCEATLHVGFRVPWSKGLVPSVVLHDTPNGCLRRLYSARKKFDGSRDLRLAVGVFGVCSLITGLVTMQYAEYLGIANSGTLANNWLLFSASVLTGTLIAVASVWRLKIRF
jgi:hypothetical protein